MAHDRIGTPDGSMHTSTARWIDFYLARVDVHFDKAKELFNSAVTIPLGSDASAELCRYFQIRKAWDLRQYRSVSEGDLIFRKSGQGSIRWATVRISVSRMESRPRDPRRDPPGVRWSQLSGSVSLQNIDR
jgi:hypothetical protein